MTHHTSTPTSSIWLVTWTDSLLVLLLVVHAVHDGPKGPSFILAHRWATFNVQLSQVILQSKRGSVTITSGKTLDSAVMTTRAEK
jgi:hypothetical protein